MKSNGKVYKSDILVIGSGAGAYGVISELVKKKYTIVVAEEGRKAVTYSKETIKRANSIYKPEGSFPETSEGILYYRHIGAGGTVEISCANGVLPSEKNLEDLGIPIEDELKEVSRELKIKEMPDSLIGDNNGQLLSSARALDFEMNAMPKFIDFEKCSSCALCELICPRDAKWSTKKAMESFDDYENVTIVHETRIQKIEPNETGDSHALGLDVSNGEESRFEAKIIIIAAGGIGTPVILQNSGIEAGSGLFLDLYVNVYGRSKKFSQGRDIPMPAFYSDPDDSFLVAPYLDIDLWYGLSKLQLSKWFAGEFYNGLMVKISDDSNGSVNKNGTIHKGISTEDQKKIDKGVAVAEKILLHAGAGKDSIIVTGPKGAHPGGTAAIGSVVDSELRVKGTDNIFVADSSVFSSSPCKPPILTIMALAKRLGKTL
ncbi:MAG: hypothetical protein GY754_38220 [bacterium]|nr:hypothetical protein [bacterium]